MHQPYVDVVLVKQLYFNKTNYSLGHFSWMQSHVFCFTEVQLCFHRAPHQLIRNHILMVKVQINLTFDYNKILRHISSGVPSYLVSYLTRRNTRKLDRYFGTKQKNLVILADCCWIFSLCCHSANCVVHYSTNNVKWRNAFQFRVFKYCIISSIDTCVTLSD